MGRPVVENKKINKSGRFEPTLLDEMQKSTKTLNLNLSQTLEFFSEIGVKVAQPELYNKIRAISAKKRKDIPLTIEEILTEYCNNFPF